MENPGEQFLHKKDPKLHTSFPIEHETKRKKARGEEVSQKPADKISDWLEVIKRTHTGHREDPEAMERIRNYYHKEYVIKPEDIPESYYENQKRLAREQGHGDIEITEENRQQLSEVAVRDQETTLDNWTDYFTSPDSDSYPMWAKYWAFTSMLKLSTFDKEKHAFSKRDKGTVAPFPDLNREALAYAVDAVVKKANNEKIQVVENNPELKQLLDGANFGKLYAYAIEKVTPTEKNELENTQGKWVKYKQGTDHLPLAESLQGHGTNWCTAGESTAQAQLQGGDFYVYYSLDQKGKPTIPRAAIRMQGNNIAEVRGIAGKDQNMDSYIAPVVAEKLKEFPDGRQYEKKSADMKFLTEIENKTLRLRSGQTNQELTKDELMFLYEIDSKIEGFGYQNDPRIEEIRAKRNLQEDLPILFDCEPNQIAFKKEDLTPDTVAYIGSWTPAVLNLIPETVKYIYESFPDKKVFLKTIETDPNITSPKKAEQVILAGGSKISNYAKEILLKTPFSKENKEYNLVSFSVESLGFLNGATTEQIYKKAREFGLELCPTEVGPLLRLNYPDQPNGEYLFVAMETIKTSDGSSRVFGVIRVGGERWLDARWGDPGYRWYGGGRFVFLRRK